MSLVVHPDQSSKKSDNPEGRALSIDSINPLIKKMQYAVRGAIPMRALELQTELYRGMKLPFEEVIKANIGDCHATGSKSITYIRQILSACTYPQLMEMDSIFPKDVVIKSKYILSQCGSGQSLGSYSESDGIDCIRKAIAHFIAARDGISVDYRSIFAAAGASDGIRPGDIVSGVMIPVPQYPLYTAVLTEYGMERIEYFLNEDNLWEVTIEELERAFESAGNCNPRAIVVINPGNPTGQLLNRDNIEAIIRFAKNHNLLVMADEVYQDVVYESSASFVSFRRVMLSMPAPYNSTEIASFYSASKGYMGECGARAGYCQLENFDPEVVQQFRKLISTTLCPPTWGQVVMGVVANPPEPGDESYELFQVEKERNLSQLREKAYMVTELLNAIPGIECNRVMGAMYAFPKLELPLKFIREAETRNMAPDGFYCLSLLERTGICVVPGSGFGQKKGTYHFRTTVLPEKDVIASMFAKLRKFQDDISQSYS